jgi:hypothetical protein
MSTAFAQPGASNCSVEDLVALHRKPLGPPAPLPPQEKPGGVLNHCPFRCTIDKLDELGYCEHLIGFTTNGQTLEPLKARLRQVFDISTGRPMRDEITGKPILETDGTFFVDGRPQSLQPVLKGDVVKFVTQDGKQAISGRVYRGKPGDPSPTPSKPLRDMQTEELIETIEELHKRLLAQGNKELAEEMP